MEEKERIIKKVFSSKYLSRQIFKSIQPTILCHKKFSKRYAGYQVTFPKIDYCQWTSVDEIVENGRLKLLVDKIKSDKPLQWSSRAVEKFCENVGMDTATFKFVYERCQHRFLSSRLISFAIASGNTEIVDILMNQTYPIKLPMDHAWEVAIKKGRVHMLQHLASRLVDRPDINDRINTKHLINNALLHDRPDVFKFVQQHFKEHVQKYIDTPNFSKEVQYWSLQTGNIDTIRMFINTQHKYEMLPYEYLYFRNHNTDTRIEIIDYLVNTVNEGRPVSIDIAKTREQVDRLLWSRVKSVVPAEIVNIIVLIEVIRQLDVAFNRPNGDHSRIDQFVRHLVLFGDVGLVPYLIDQTSSNMPFEIICRWGTPAQFRVALDHIGTNQSKLSHRAFQLAVERVDDFGIEIFREILADTARLPMLSNNSPQLLSPGSLAVFRLLYEVDHNSLARISTSYIHYTLDILEFIAQIGGVVESNELIHKAIWNRDMPLLKLLTDRLGYQLTPQCKVVEYAMSSGSYETAKHLLSVYPSFINSTILYPSKEPSKWIWRTIGQHGIVRQILDIIHLIGGPQNVHMEELTKGASQGGSIHLLTFIYDKGWHNEYYPMEAIPKGHLEVIKLFKSRKPIDFERLWKSMTLQTIQNGHVHVLKFLMIDTPNTLIHRFEQDEFMKQIIDYEHLEMFMYLATTLNYPFKSLESLTNYGYASQPVKYLSQHILKQLGIDSDSPSNKQEKDQPIEKPRRLHSPPPQP